MLLTPAFAPTNGMVIHSSEEQPLNAPSPIPVTKSGIVNSVMDLFSIPVIAQLSIVESNRKFCISVFTIVFAIIVRSLAGIVKTRIFSFDKRVSPSYHPTKS